MAAIFELDVATRKAWECVEKAGAGTIRVAKAAAGDRRGIVVEIEAINEELGGLYKIREAAGASLHASRFEWIAALEARRAKLIERMA